MFAKSRKLNRILALALSTGSLGAVVLATNVAPASARAVASSGAARLSDAGYPAPRFAPASSDPIYQLNPDEMDRVCGDFRGTIIYSDGYAVDCSTGAVYFTQ